MSRRNYEQVCALARALDLIGERWTLLIVRELLFGARRYSDLSRELPGLGTNLLAQRLKDLEEAGLIAHGKLPPPAGSSVYELTASGREMLMPIIRAMTDFGVHHLHYPPPARHFVPVSAIMGALSKFFKGDSPQDYSCVVEFHTRKDIFHCRIANETITALGFGPLSSSDLAIKGTTDLIMGLVVGYINVEQALKRDDLEILRGDIGAVTTFFDCFVGEFDETTSF